MNDHNTCNTCNQCITIKFIIVYYFVDYIKIKISPWGSWHQTVMDTNFLCFVFINIHLIAFNEKVMSMYWHAKQHGMFVFRIPFSLKKVPLTHYLNSSSWNVRLHSLLSRLLNCKSPLSIIADLAVGYDYILHHIPDG